jgi:polysaccharide biosynthesis protein PslJ
VAALVRTLGVRSARPALAVVIPFAILTAAALAGGSAARATPLVALALTLGLTHRTLLRWQVLLSFLLLVIFFIPIRRYALPGGLPFQLEPYRILIAFVAAGWIASLLVDPRVRLHRSHFDGPLLAITLSICASIVWNHSHIAALGVQSEVTKRLTFFLSFVLIVYLFASLVRTYEALDAIVRTLVASGGVLALSALVESATHYNVFNHLQGHVPLLRFQGLPYSLVAQDLRGGRLRVYASSEHPIALGALFAMLLPLAVYVARTRGRRWWPAVTLLFLGSVATVSRTAIVMLIVIVLMYVWLRRREVRVLWPLVLPALVAVHIALPGTLGSLSQSFFPKGGLVQQQRQGAHTRGSGRIADIGPAVAQWRKDALFGEGYGSRETDKTRLQNALILDDQWLGTLLEVGFVGTVAWIWLFIAFVRRLAREAKEDRTDRGWLAVALAGGPCAYAVGMLTYDAFSFVQVTVMLFVFFGLGGALLSISRAPAAVPQY